MHDPRDRNQGIWIEASDRLYVAAYSSVASLVVTFSGYFRKANGEIIEYSVTVNPTSDRAVTEGNQFFGAGFLLSCVASLASGNANRGQCYVRAMVQRSSGTPMVKLHNVLGGYLSDDYSPSFPYGKIEGPLEGPGYIRSVTVTAPVANTPTDTVVPTGARWLLRGVHFTFTADANVGNRFMQVWAFSSAGTYWVATATQAIVAGAEWIVNFANGLERLAETTNLYYAQSIPLQPMKATDTVEITYLGGKAGDIISLGRLAVEEWIEA